MTVASFIASQRTDHSVPQALSCRALQVSESWFYKWRDRPSTGRQQRQDDLDVAVKKSFDSSGGNPGTYGSPRVWEDLMEAGWQVSKKKHPHFPRLCESSRDVEHVLTCLRNSERRYKRLIRRKTNAHITPHSVERFVEHPLNDCRSRLGCREAQGRPPRTLPHHTTKSPTVHRPAAASSRRRR